MHRHYIDITLETICHGHLAQVVGGKTHCKRTVYKSSLRGVDQSSQLQRAEAQNRVTDFRVRRWLIVLYVKPVPQLVVVVFPNCAPKIIVIGILLSIVYQYFL